MDESPPIDDEDRRAYDLKARVVHARHAFKKSYKKHSRNIMVFGRLRVKVGNARLAAINEPANEPRMRLFEALYNRAMTASDRSVRAMGEARERLDDAERNWGEFRRGFPAGHVFTFPSHNDD